MTSREDPSWADERAPAEHFLKLNKLLSNQVIKVDSETQLIYGGNDEIISLE